MVTKLEGYLSVNSLDNDYIKYYYTVKYVENIPKVGAE